MAKSRHFKEARLLAQRRSREVHKERNIAIDESSTVTMHNCSSSAETPPSGFSKTRRTVRPSIQSGEVSPINSEMVLNSVPRERDTTTGQPNAHNHSSDGIGDDHQSNSTHRVEQPTSSIESIGVRELTVGELLLGRQQQLNVLKRLKQRMQMQKLNCEQSTASDEPSCGESTRKKYQRTITSFNDDFDRPITALTLGELYRKSWAQRPAVKRFDANDFIRMHAAEIAKSKAALRRKHRVTFNKEADIEGTCSESDVNNTNECSLYNLFSMNFSYSTADPCEVNSSDPDVEGSSDAVCPSNLKHSSTSADSASETSVHNLEQLTSNSITDEIAVSQLLSTPLTADVFLETMSWMKRQSELADQESFEEYLSATISHLSSGTTIGLNLEKDDAEKTLKKTKLRSERTEQGGMSRQQRFSNANHRGERVQKTKRHIQTSHIKDKQDDKCSSFERKPDDHLINNVKCKQIRDVDEMKKVDEPDHIKSKGSVQCIGTANRYEAVENMTSEGDSMFPSCEGKANGVKQAAAICHNTSASEPVGRHVAAKRRHRCSGLVKLEGSLNVDDPFRLHCEDPCLQYSNENEKFDRFNHKPSCFPSEASNNVVRRGLSRRILKVKH